MYLSKLVRHSSARVIAAIASVEVPLGQWNELMPFLEQTCTSSNVGHREVGSFILFTVLENIVEGFESHMQSLFRLFEQLIADPESLEVRITAVRCVGRFTLVVADIYTSLVIGRWASLPSTSMATTRRTLCVLSASVISYAKFAYLSPENFPAIAPLHDQRHWPVRRSR